MSSFNHSRSGRTAKAAAVVREMERQELAKYDPFSDNDGDIHVVNSPTCPIQYGKDAQNDEARGWYDVSPEEGDRMDNIRANVKKFNQVWVEKDGVRVPKQLRTSTGRRCVRYRPEGEKKRLEWNEVIGEVRKLVRHIKQDVRLPMTEKTREQERAWKKETKEHLKKIARTKLIESHPQDAYFEPDIDGGGCNPGGDVNSAVNKQWKKLYGTPLHPLNPNIRPTEYELRTNRWHRPAIMSIEGKPRCVPYDWKDKNNRTLESKYPVSYHDFDALKDPDIKLPMDTHGPQDPMKFYRNAMVCAQQVGGACKELTGGEVPAPLGGLVTPNEVCEIRNDTASGDFKCVPKELREAPPGKIFNKDDELNMWYKKFYEREHKNIRKDPYMNMAMYGTQGLQQSLPGGEKALASARRMAVQGMKFVGQEEEYYDDYSSQGSEGDSLMSTEYGH